MLSDTKVCEGQRQSLQAVGFTRAVSLRIEPRHQVLAIVHYAPLVIDGDGERSMLTSGRAALGR